MNITVQLIRLLAWGSELAALCAPDAGSLQGSPARGALAAWLGSQALKSSSFT